MAKACCVDGCLAKDDLFFRFPNSRTLCKKWTEAVKLSTKPGHNSVLCSAHFKPDDYALVRGKVRLKPKVIPSLHNNKLSKANNTLQNILADSEKGENESAEERTPKEEVRLEKNNRVTNKSPNNNDANTEDKKSVNSSKSSLKKNKENGNIQKSSRSRGKRKIKAATAKRPTNKKKKNEESPKEATETVEEASAAEAPGREDIEEFLTYFHIRQNKNVAERQNAELERERTRNGGGDESEVIDLAVHETEPKPVFIEVSIDKDNLDGRGSPRDCLMVIESVQVELDPNDLLLDDPEDLHDADETIVIDDKPEEAISLLTSSDEDDVILQEPHIDTVVVSDESASEATGRRERERARRKARSGRGGGSGSGRGRPRRRAVARSHTRK